LQIFNQRLALVGRATLDVALDLLLAGGQGVGRRSRNKSKKNASLTNK
jgi:hypothetical protein